MQKVNILGVEYTIEYGSDIEAAGETDYSTKLIRITKRLDKEFEGSCEDIITLRNFIVRHEIIHAMMFEGGIWENNNDIHNEETVDWIALQYSKMNKIFTELEIN